ncbi:MAG: hypothetical protein ROO73_01470 [Roseivirga sp.]
MASTQIQTITVENMRADRNKGVITGSGSVSFSSNVLDATATVKSWQVGFTSGDHQIQAIGVDVTEDHSSQSPVVNFSVTLTFHDKGYDDDIFGRAKVAVLAYCE